MTAKHYVDGAEYELELKQVLGTVFISEDIGPEHTLMVGQDGLFLVGPNAERLEPITLHYVDAQCRQALLRTTSRFLPSRPQPGPALELLRQVRDYRAQEAAVGRRRGRGRSGRRPTTRSQIRSAGTSSTSASVWRPTPPPRPRPRELPAGRAASSPCAVPFRCDPRCARARCASSIWISEPDSRRVTTTSR